MNTDPVKAAANTIQAEVIAFLGDPQTHSRKGIAVDSVQRINTHAAIVFLAGQFAYKIKRAVAYPFLDYSTLEKRRLVCEHEIEVNQANAPQIYIGVVAITRQADHSLKIDGAGEVVEWAVLMKRFDENQTLDKIVESGPLSDTLANSLACAMVRAHARAPLRQAGPWIAALRKYINHNSEDFTRHPDMFPIQPVSRLTEASIAAYQQIKPLLETRGAAGHVRLCHGDAHLGNIVRINDQPIFFDAIEFNDIIATGDVLYDLAFLLMDLWHRGHRHEANLVFNRYLIECRSDDHYQGLAALPFFMMMRSAIRARVTTSRRKFCPDHQQASLIEQAAGYFSTACDFLNNEPPKLVAVGGLSGSGKSTIAASIAAKIGRAPGAVVLRSDVIRKKLFGVAETENLPQSAYTSTVSQTVYERMYELSSQVLKSGHSVIVDAVFDRERERDAIADVGRLAGIALEGIWLDAPEKILVARVSARKNDASDADEGVVRKQMAFDPGTITWRKINATGKLADVLKRVENTLG